MGSRKVPPEKTATRDELDAAVAALTDVDLVRLEKFARWRITRIAAAADGRDQMDLIEEAYQLTYEGRRAWNKENPFLVHMFRTIRSISSHWAEAFATEREHGRDLISTKLDTRTDRIVVRQEPDAERSVISRDVLERVRQLFADDALASNMIGGLEDGLDGPAITKLLEIDQRTYDSKLRAIRRRLEAEGLKEARKGRPT